MSTHFFGLNQRAYEYSHSVGRQEFSGTGFRMPVDMAVGEGDLVYVLNRSYESRTDGIHVTMMTLNEEYVSEFGSHGEGDGQFVWPAAIALDPEGNVYVADEWLNRVSIFDKDGQFLSSWGRPGSGDGELDRPAGIAIRDNGTLFLTDSRNHRVQAFSLDGQFRSKFGSLGDGPGQLHLPWGIGLDKDGQVFVADWRNDRIQQFTADGEWQASFGQSGSGVGQFRRPASVCVDDDGDIYVADWGNNRVQVLTPDGRFVTAMHGDHELSKLGKEKLLSNPDMIRQRALAMAHNPYFDRRFEHPSSVKLDRQGRICVLDTKMARIQIYTKTKEPTLV